MFTVEVRNSTGVPVGTVTIEKKLLGEKVRNRLLQEACVMYEANRRAGTAKAKTRAEVAGSREKPWRQKGTGRARAGTKQSPVWRGGGVVHGPRPRSYSYDIGRKARRQALKSALFSKFEDNEVFVLDEFVAEEPKTRDAARMLDAFGLDKVLVVLKGHKRNAGEGEDDFFLTRNANVVKSLRNIPNAAAMNFADLNAYDVLRYKNLLFTREAFEGMKEFLS